MLRIFSGNRSCVVWGLLVMGWGAPSQTLGSLVEEYAGLSEGLQKTYQIIRKEDDIEVERRLLKTIVLPKKTIDNKDVIPEKVNDKALNSKNKMKRTFIDYMQLSSDKLVLFATKYDDEIDMHMRDKMLLKIPLDLGATWITGAYEKTVEEKNDTIQVPAGVFTHCLRVKTIRKIEGQLAYEEATWYAPGVGEIKKIATYTQEGTQIITQLMTLKKQAPKIPMK